jgi:FHS family glucose/mannose:H+ symporter-like MFS transporter
VIDVSAVPEPLSEENSRTATIVAYCIFAATGVGLVLPGALLSQLLTRWSLNDQQAGLLFFVFFVGSSVGALLARGRLSRSIAVGSLSIAASSFALNFASSVTCFLAIAAMGVGLGTTMTSVSLLQSRRRPNTRTSEMARLNLVWSLGACISPALMLKANAMWSLDVALCSVGAAFLLFALVAVILLPDVGPQDIRQQDEQSRNRFEKLPLLLLLIVPLATGVESSTGSWLAAYSRRSGLLLGGTISTVSCFWLGLLVARLVQAYTALASASQTYALRVGSWLAAAALLLLILGPTTTYSNVAMPLSAFVVGIGIGPIYPLALSLLLDIREAGNIVFLIAGVGSSTLPLLTGIASAHSGSLATGLSIPLLDAVAMAIFSMLFVLQRRSARR